MPVVLTPRVSGWLSQVEDRHRLAPEQWRDKDQTNSVLGGTGCLYTGPTRIVFNNDGTMNVTSPFSTGTNPVTGAPRNRNGCGVGSNLPLPANGVIFVQNVPAATTDPNYTNQCVAGFYPGGLPPAATPPARQDITPYRCTDGDAFVSGVYKGQVTVAADHNIVINGNLTRFNQLVSSTDVLGLVANSYVEIYHPVRCLSGCGTPASATYTNLAGTLVSPQIDAAILSVAHSFRAQNPRRGEGGLGTIKIVGAIGQKYRGFVTQNGKGYLKNYIYDSRLKVLSPPYFLDPVEAAWQVQKWSEVTTPSGW